MEEDYTKEFQNPYSNDYWNNNKYIPGDRIDNFNGEGWTIVEYDKMCDAQVDFRNARKIMGIFRPTIIKERGIFYLVYLDLGSN